MKGGKTLRFICQVKRKKTRAVIIIRGWRSIFFKSPTNERDERFHAATLSLSQNQTLIDSFLPLHRREKKQRTAQKEEASYYHPARPRQSQLSVCPGADECNRGENTSRFLYAETHVVSRGIIDRFRRQEQARAPQQPPRRAWQPRPPPSWEHQQHRQPHPRRCRKRSRG